MIAYQNTKKNRRLTWLIPISIYLTAIAVRALINFSSPAIPGVNGGYYPLMVRNLIEYGSMGIADLPLVFTIEFLIAHLIKLFSGLALNDAVLMAVRLFDSLIPPLAVFPVFLTARILLPNNKMKGLLLFLISGFSVLTITFLVVLTSEMHKNACGMIWLALLFYSLLKTVSTSQKKHLWGVVTAVVLLSVTHLGCFAVGLLFMVMASFFFVLPYVKRNSWRLLFFVAAGLGVALLAGLTLMNFDPERIMRLKNIILKPASLFESPWLFLLLNDQNPFRGFLSFQMLIIEFSSFGFLIFFIRKLKHTEKGLMLIGISLSLLAIFLASPMVGMEWVLRFQLMAFLPWIFVIILVLRYELSPMLAWSTSLLLSSWILFSLFTGLKHNRYPVINQNDITELRNISSNTSITRDDIILAKHGLEWWAGWYFGSRVGQEFSLSQSELETYKRIYLLRQKSGHNPGFHRGSGGFTSYPISNKVKVIAETDSFILFEIQDSADLSHADGTQPLMSGKILAKTAPGFRISDGATAQVIQVDPGTSFLEIPENMAHAGDQIIVWGKGHPFSLKVTASRLLITRGYIGN